MNRRIREFAEQATTEDHDGFRYFDKQKFAELIVRECAKIADDLDDAVVIYDLGSGKQCTKGQMVKRHFEIK